MERKRGSARIRNILFVCVENSCRSQMAEGFARKLGQEKVQPYSAGSRPSGRVNPNAVTVMKEKGIKLGGQRSKSLDDLPHQRWDAIVTMGCGDACPHLPAERRFDWNLPDPKGKPMEEFRRVRDEIEILVAQLLEELGVAAQKG